MKKHFISVALLAVLAAMVVGYQMVGRIHSAHLNKIKGLCEIFRVYQIY